MRKIATPVIAQTNTYADQMWRDIEDAGQSTTDLAEEDFRRVLYALATTYRANPQQANTLLTQSLRAINQTVEDVIQK